MSIDYRTTDSGMNECSIPHDYRTQKECEFYYPASHESRCTWIRWECFCTYKPEFMQALKGDT